MKIVPIPAFKDNYIWALINDQQQVIVVDPGEALPVISFLNAYQLQLAAILVTHHHWDHTGGIVELVDEYGAPVYGSMLDPIPGVTIQLADKDTFRVADFTPSFSVIDIPGHTLGHIAYYTGEDLFCGDTLFAGGCGRIFEGTASQMYASLQKLRALPDKTHVYCGHEYTVANLRFALKVEPDNKDLQKRYDAMLAMHDRGEVTLPSTIIEEKKTNPFLRCDQASVQKSVSNWAGKNLSDEVDVFAALREWKNKG